MNFISQNKTILAVILTVMLIVFAVLAILTATSDDLQRARDGIDLYEKTEGTVQGNALAQNLDEWEDTISEYNTRTVVFAVIAGICLIGDALVLFAKPAKN
ncbi:MAG: hypothetical protein E7575_00460 [Ruminococcaceae bacterium]|nr:hypothetical protein [Oscillospiraceae bacterium]